MSVPQEEDKHALQPKECPTSPTPTGSQEEVKISPKVNESPEVLILD